jgi:hypothetical protein
VFLALQVVVRAVLGRKDRLPFCSPVVFIELTASAGKILAGIPPLGAGRFMLLGIV